MGSLRMSCSSVSAPLQPSSGIFSQAALAANHPVRESVGVPRLGKRTWWRLLRYFTLGEASGARAGFLAQSPQGPGCTAVVDCTV